MRSAKASSQRYSESSLFRSVREETDRQSNVLFPPVSGEVKFRPEPWMRIGVWKKLNIGCVLLASCAWGYCEPLAVSATGPPTGSAAVLPLPARRVVQNPGFVSLSV